jgi:hypothetical protein
MSIPANKSERNNTEHFEQYSEADNSLAGTIGVQSIHSYAGLPRYS